MLLVSNIALNNWTGEKVDVKICEKTKSFSFRDYVFTLENYEETDPSESELIHMSFVSLYGDSWDRDEPLVTLHFDGHGVSIEKQLKAAIAWIANYV